MPRDMPAPECREGLNSYTVDKSSAVRLYSQIAERIRLAIDLSELDQKDAIPSEKEWAQTFGVSLPTIGKAMDILAADGVIIRRQGRGTFIATGAPIRIPTVTRTDSVPSKTTARRHVLTEQISPGYPLPQPFNPKDPVLHTVRIEEIDGMATALLEDFMHPRLAPNHRKRIMASGANTFFENLGKGLAVRYEVRTVCAGGWIAGLMRVPTDTPLLVLERTTSDNDATVLEHARYSLLSSRYTFSASYSQ